MPEENKITEGNVHPDHSVLSRDSDFYQPEDTRTTREKLKSMKFKDKVGFIVQYYGLKILAVSAAAALVVYLILHFALAKETALSIMAVNAQDIMTSSAAADEKSFYDDFLKQNGIDPDKVEIGISSNVNVVVDDSDSSSIADIQSVQVQLMAGTDDIIFADEEFFTSIGEMGYLADLSAYLPTDILEQYADEIVYATNIDTNDKIAVGIRLKDNAWIAKSGWFANVKEPMIGICAATQNADLAQKFMLYVLGWQP